MGVSVYSFSRSTETMLLSKSLVTRTIQFNSVVAWRLNIYRILWCHIFNTICYIIHRSKTILLLHNIHCFSRGRPTICWGRTFGFLLPLLISILGCVSGRHAAVGGLYWPEEHTRLRAPQLPRLESRRILQRKRQPPARYMRWRSPGGIRAICKQGVCH